MATHKLDKKITGYKVKNAGEIAAEIALAEIATIHTMNETHIRPEMLLGSTYKIKPPHLEHALYITINDVILNEDTPHEKRHPYEVFLNSKNMDQFQWVLALTRVISAVFRKGGEVSFLVDELKNVFDPKGGYFKRGGVFMPSLVAEIGHAIEKHLIRIGYIEAVGLDADQKKLLAQKRQDFEAKNEELAAVTTDSDNGDYPAKATVCAVCSVKAVILLDGCKTCLHCSDSKCG